MEFNFLLVLVILILSLIQSLFGIGVLAIGTPTLLLLGLSFFETLSIILPCSICISICQIYDSKIIYFNFMSKFILYCLPFVIISLLFLINLNEQINLKILIASMLFCSGILRLGIGNYQPINNFLIRYSFLTQALIGIIHGFTNMGGAILALFSSSVFKREKDGTRFGIAFGYAIMGIVQYIMILYIAPDLFKFEIFLYIIISLLSYIFFGRVIFRLIESNIYDKYLTYIILSYSIIILVGEFF